MIANGHGILGNMWRAGLNALGRGAAGAVKGAASATVDGLTAVGKVETKIGKVGAKVGMKAADKTGRKMVQFGKEFVGGLNSSNGLENPIGMVINRGEAFGSSISKIERTTKKYNPYTGEVETKLGGISLNKKGLGLLVGFGAIGSAVRANEDMQAQRMGTVSPEVTTAAPTPVTDVNYYQKGEIIRNGGADGSLVFAMHKNRHG